MAEFIPDTEVRRDLGKTKMCLSRWDRHPEKAPPGWPAKIKMGTRNFRHRSDYEAFVAGLVNTALADRELALERAGARRSREQIAKFNPPTRPTKREGNRHANTFEGDSVELDALPSNVLRTMVRKVIEQHITPRDLEVLRAAEDSERELLDAWADRVEDGEDAP